MNRQTKTTREILEVIPDILLWVDNNGKLLDFHPNNHSFLFEREEGVIGCSLEKIFDRELGLQMRELIASCRKENGLQAGEVTCRINGTVSRFECRMTPVDSGSLIAGWREITHLTESRKGALIRGNNKATLILLTESSLEEAIESSFRILGTTYQADRISLFRNQFAADSQEVCMTLEHTWSQQDISTGPPDLQLARIPYHPGFTDLFNTLRKNTPVIAITEDLRGEMRSQLERMEIRSVVIMPVFARNQFWGFLAIGDCRTPRVWKEEEVGALKAVSVILGSVIQKHQDQEELTIARLRAEESDRLKSSILANINHELRTPMTGILGFSEILCEFLEPSEARQMAENIQISGRRLLATLNSMIELSQFEAKKALFKLMDTKLNELILLACEPHITAAKKKKLHFEIRMNESIFSFIDENLFTQLLNHILENAVKFTHSGGITVETANAWDAGKSWSCIRVIDTGPGIQSDFHDVIFEEFRQVSEGYNRSFEGSGLGLTLAKKIVELMNGRLTLLSEPNMGSTFTIWLPSSQVQGCNTLPCPPQPSLLAEVHDYSVEDSASGLPLILVVEDNYLNCELIQIYLRDQCICDVSRDGATAVEMARARHYDAILMDINLGPGMDGMETTRRIRGIQGYQLTPIIAVTGYTMDSDKEEILGAGCSHYLPKPIEKNNLSALIGQLVGKR